MEQIAINNNEINGSYSFIKCPICFFEGTVQRTYRIVDVLLLIICFTAFSIRDKL